MRLRNWLILPTLMHQSQLLQSKTQQLPKRLPKQSIRLNNKRMWLKLVRQHWRKLTILNFLSLEMLSQSPTSLVLEVSINKNLMTMPKRKKLPGNLPRHKQAATPMSMVTQLSRNQFHKLQASEWTSPMRMALDMLAQSTWDLKTHQSKFCSTQALTSWL